ncbi:hypothetical protein AWB82_06075 [Caballeronia glebae]|uniref:Uncharacterized protein n=1 Tax=Caballeronia glebae TaxID=1777143 RepID=A0A158D007_9BURK|nr:protein DpdD [Caballeronia glebae]SAK87893.1 hypothetical protein AWB82_06075 [Caballeronia glebae]
MTQKDLAAFANLITGFREVAAIAALSPETREEFETLAQSASMSAFPGVLLTWPRPGKCSIYYAVATDAAQWRRLRPLLMAFAGATVTSFDGLPAKLLPRIPVERYLLSDSRYITARIVPGEGRKHRETTRRALERLLTTIERAPAITSVIPRATSSLLASFGDCLNGNDRTGAEQILDICSSELRVDALNLTFLRIRLLSHFSDWCGIVELPEFASLCHTRKPPTVTAILLEALWQVYLAPFYGIESFDELQARWVADVRSFASLLLRLPIQPDSSPGVLRLFAWQAITDSADSSEFRTALEPYRGLLGEFESKLEIVAEVQEPTIGSDVPPFGAAEVDPVSQAQYALAVAEDLNSLATISEALTRVAQLSDQDRKALLRSELFKSTWQTVQMELGSAPPTDWEAWLSRLPDPSFTGALSVLERAATEWPVSAVTDAVDIERLATALLSVPDSPPADERLADALPLLVSWVARDTDFPRPSMVPVYEALLFHLVLGARRGSAVFDSAAILIRALLAVGVAPSRYTTLLDDCLALTGEGVGVRNVYWLLDILEEAFLNQAPSPQARENFSVSVQSRLAPLRHRLTPGQKISLHALGSVLEWTPTDGEHPGAPPDASEKMQSLAAALHSRTIGIYSLTESAARQAAQVLKQLDSSIKVLLSHDAVGTPTLKTMALGVDLMIVATASAKHAATGFIQQVRPREKPTRFAAGRGFSSIIRTIEEYYLASV